MTVRGARRSLSALLLGLNVAALAQSPPPPESNNLVEALRAAAKPLSAVTPGGDDSDLSFVCPLTKQASVVSLGEPGHGAHEPLSFRNRLFEYLVEHCGFTAIAIETAFTESRAVHDFVEQGAGSAAELVRTHFSWGFGDYKENVQLIDWMRTYNQRRNTRRPLEFYGIDLSGADNDSGFPNAVIALSSVLDFLRQAAPNESAQLRLTLAPLMTRWAGDGYARAAQDNDPDLDRAQRSLSRFLKVHSASLRRAGSQSQYEWAVHGLVVAERLRQLLRLKSPTSDVNGLGPDDYKQVNVRDAAMAENVLWIRGQEHGGRMLIFAHNAHVMNARTRGGIWSAFAKPPIMMGCHLHAALKQSLLIVGMSAGHNSPPLPAENSAGGPVAESTFAELHEPLFWLNLRALGDDPMASAWAAQRQRIHANFNSVIEVGLFEAFDALVYLETVTPANR